MSEQDIAEEAVLDSEQPNLEATDQDEVSQTAGDSGESHEKKVTFNEEQQKVFNDMAAKKAFETREQKRANEELQRQIKELQAAQPVEQAPNIPDMPDQYSDNYEQEMAARDKALQDRAAFDANASYLRQQADLQAQESQRLENEALSKSLEDYSGRAQKLGISDKELEVAGNTVYEYGINDHVAKYILADEHGPLITKYLSENPVAMESLNSMPPISAGAFIESQVKPQAIKFKPTTTNAPSPIETLVGAGVPPSEHPALKGGVFK
jgi:hypothetical protein